MRSFWITLTAGTMALLLSGCPDLPGGPVPGQSDSHWKAAHPLHTPHDNAAHAAGDTAAHHAAAHHGVSEIAWFQGTIDEAFSRRGCAESHPRRTLFRF
jgi:hypothetical protein